MALSFEYPRPGFSHGSETPVLGEHARNVLAHVPGLAEIHAVPLLSPPVTQRGAWVPTGDDEADVGDEIAVQYRLLLGGRLSTDNL